VNDIERSRVSLSVYDDSDSTNVVSASDHDDVSGIELDEVGDLASLNIELDAVVDSDQRIGISNSAAIVKNNIRNTLLASGDSSNLAKLVLGLISRNSLKNKSSLGIVEESEVLSSLLDGDNILESSGVSRIGSDLSVDLDESLHDDLRDFVSSKGVFQSVSQQNNEGKALS